MAGPRLPGWARAALIPVHQTHARKLHELRSLFLELTHDCNLDCIHCGSDCTRESRAGHLDARAILKTLVEIKNRYDPHAVCVAMSGGEPLCYPGLFELGTAITRLEFPWGMVTNGFAWTRETVRRAKDAGLQSITVSLDGMEANHDWMRGWKGSFARAAATISWLTADRFYQAMDVVTCVNRRNLGELPEVRAFLKSIGVRDWRLFTISPIGRAGGNPELFLDADEYRRLLEMIIEWRRQTDMNVNLSESGYLGASFECRVRDAQYFCRAGINVAGVMVNGDILACPNIDRRFAQGNIEADSFVDVWERKFAPFRDRTWMKAGPCEKCPEWRLCQGNSFHLWDLDAGRPRVCHFRDFGLGPQPADRR